MQRQRALKLGFEIHEFKPFPAEAQALIADYAELGTSSVAVARPQPRAKYAQAPVKRHGVRVGLHAKSMVIDGEITVIGSHNFDPRSESYNTEAGIIVRDRAFAARVRAAILQDTAAEGNAWTIARRPPTRFLEPASTTRSPIFPPRCRSSISWPFRYAGSFRTESGSGLFSAAARRTRLLRLHYTGCRRFSRGSTCRSKSIYTRIVTAFGAGLVSIM